MCRNKCWELLLVYAIDNCVALEFIDNDIKVIKSDKNKNAYKFVYTDDKVIEEIIK